MKMSLLLENHFTLEWKMFNNLTVQVDAILPAREVREVQEVCCSHFSY
jgi:hypothetical protein